MLRQSSKFLILTVVIAAVALYAVTEAGAVSVSVNLNGDCDSTELAQKACYKIADPILSGNWVVEVIPDAGGNFPAIGPYGALPVGVSLSDPECFDKRGNPINCVEFAYYITAPTDGTLSQFNVQVPTLDRCIIDIISGDRSVKRRDQNPDTGFAAGPTWDAFTWDAIKTDPSNHAVASVFTSPASAEENDFELKTGNGNLIGSILTPFCCSETILDTRNLLTLPAQEVPNETCDQVDIAVDYDICSGEAFAPTAVQYSATQVELTVENVVAARCDDDGGQPDLRSCHQIKKLGTRSGTLFNSCSDDGFNIIYVGYAEDIYRIQTTNSCNDTCGIFNPDITGPCIRERIFNNGLVKFVFDDTCDVLEQICIEGANPYCATPSVLGTDVGELAIWVCSDSRTAEFNPKKFDPELCSYITDFDIYATGVAEGSGWGGYGGYGR
jgi:hypothetical protein